MPDDRYKYVAQILTYFGWLQDSLLRNTRTYAVKVLKERNVGFVLDACCGAGTLSVYLHNSGISVTGVDTSPSMLALARKKLPNAHLIEANLADLKLDKPVDGAVIAFSLHEMPEDSRVQVWEAIKRSTRSGAPLVVLDFALSQQKSLGTKISWKFISADERNIDRHDPGHYANFLDFMDRGGAKGWLVQKGEEIKDEKYFMWGNIGALVVNA